MWSACMLHSFAASIPLLMELLLLLNYCWASLPVGRIAVQTASNVGDAIQKCNYRGVSAISCCSEFAPAARRSLPCVCGYGQLAC